MLYQRHTFFDVHLEFDGRMRDFVSIKFFTLLVTWSFHQPNDLFRGIHATSWSYASLPT